ncbi:MAG: DMT family transporter [Proteobacteria bacterium]|nr:DMT family transporter [Pseudomonadota bacterium]
MAASIVGILVGAGITTTRFVIDQTHPGILAFLRYLIAVCCLLPPLLVSKRAIFARRDLIPLGFLGVTQFALSMWLLNYGIQFTPSTRAALIFSTLPLQTMIIGSILGIEALSLNKSLGVFLTIIGVGFVLFERVIEEGGAVRFIGDLSIFLSAFASALCSVLYRPYLEKYPTLQVSWFAMFVSVIVLIIPAAGEGLLAGFQGFTLPGWLAVCFIGTSSGLGYYLWLWALKNSTPTKVTVFLSLNPITASILGALFLNEEITLSLIMGTICVIFGLAISQLKNSL